MYLYKISSNTGSMSERASCNKLLNQQGKTVCKQRNVTNLPMHNHCAGYSLIFLFKDAVKQNSEVRRFHEARTISLGKVQFAGKISIWAGRHNATYALKTRQRHILKNVSRIVFTRKKKSDESNKALRLIRKIERLDMKFIARKQEIYCQLSSTKS